MSKRVPHSPSSWFWPRKESTWHKLRAGDITATSAAALFGVSPYMTPFDLFHRLTGAVEVVIEETERMLWGKRLQNAIADGICEDKGWRIVDASLFLYARSIAFPGMGASPDYIIEDIARPERGLGCLEIKNVDKFVGMDEWTDTEAPVHIEMQVQHQLEACDLGWGAIGGLIGGNTPKVYERERDREVGEEIGRRCVEMLDRVKRSDAPDPDFLADYDTIRTLYRNATIGKQLDLDEADRFESDRVLALIEAASAASVAAKHADEDKKRAQAELLVAIGDNERVIGRGFKVSAGTTHKSEQTVVMRATSFRNLRITKAKEQTA
ncbi:YqaJ viral recombinase family nuclease [Aureimonas sp. AU40]|uniref:YqaJ viral recombinase family nuclease n=1 Tax=Aureimonas sp. AU40 TaxID=1637747 RepID=UPI0007833FD8|nr:YqaJ viral recombinase family protein [Aureimonas sp. AU40]